ncbi:hypothetical protein NDU88_006155 [Pleurodeles waltl]|uniref:Uncharacterized protein n=1 Tax=Pleurodeles waltl TaxID=8319 RepID=A0AAV7TCM5_PLEWA|nr:hypothetical protein NDU88_006155 [Pleurodeles waltl]
MDVDAKVLEAVALVKQASRTDLLREEALVPGHPARRASAGVAAAVAASSPPRATGGSQVRGVARGAVGSAVKGVPGAGKGTAGRRGLSQDPRGFPSRRGHRTSAQVVMQLYALRQGRRGAARLQGQGIKKAGELQGRVTGKGKGSGAAPRGAGLGALSFRKGRGSGKKGYCTSSTGGPPSSEGGEEVSRKGLREGAQEGPSGIGDSRDLRVPISEKWPTMLQWSSSEEEGGAVEGGWCEGEGPITDRSLGVPKRVYGALKAGTSLGAEEISVEGDVSDREEGLVALGQGGVSSPGTPDLVWQGPLDFEEYDPIEQDAARTPWDEAKAGPGAASWMSSAGRHGRRQGAPDAPSGLCGGVGFAPPMPRFGRSNVRARQGCGRRAEGSIQAVRCVVALVSM